MTTRRLAILLVPFVTLTAERRIAAAHFAAFTRGRNQIAQPFSHSPRSAESTGIIVLPSISWRLMALRLPQQHTSARATPNRWPCSKSTGAPHAGILHQSRLELGMHVCAPATNHPPVVS